MSQHSPNHTVLNFLLALLGPLLAVAQPSHLPVHSQAGHLIDRLEILHDLRTPIHTDMRGYRRDEVAKVALEMDTIAGVFWRSDIQYLADETNDWIPDSSHLFRHSRRSFLKAFYKTPGNLFEVNTPYFKLRANPMLNLHLGKEAEDAEILFMNQRGLEVLGEVDRKAFFYTNLVETQVRFPDYVTDRVTESLAVPGAGFYKRYKGSLFDIRDGYDFNLATAYLGFQVSRHIALQLGHGQHFIGNGYRSVLLSDYATPAFFLKLSTMVRRFHYQNLFLELSPISKEQTIGDTLLPKKYAAIHYLSFKASPRFTLGLFEATVFNHSQEFKFQYLNPLILYRSVAELVHSRNHVLLGLNAKYNLFESMQVYGQFVVDGFRFKDVFSHKGWWGNQYSVQVGAKYLNALGIDHLDLQIEYNSAKPYTYSSEDPYDSYTTYNQPLAHPLGANFREYISSIRYQASANTFVAFRAIHALIGDNGTFGNWGGNVLTPYSTRVSDYGNQVGQGIRASIDLVGLDASWMFHHNMFLEAKVVLRRKDSVDNTFDQNTKLFSAGIRMNIWNPNLDF